MIRGLVVSTRPAQWLKNTFVFAAPFFAKSLFETPTALRSLAAFALFTCLSAAVYLMNDVADRERDREHPTKSKRPIAAGKLAVRVALLAAVVLGAVGIGLGVLLAWPFGVLLAAYGLIQVFYSLRLRQVVILDVFCIASGFVLRVIGGGVVADVVISSWLILTTIFLALFLALCKRRAEAVALEENSRDHRATLTEYDPKFLDQLISVTTASVVICYSLYTLDRRTVLEFGTRNLVFTVPFVIFGIFRYMYLVHRREGGGSPVKTVLRDVGLSANFLLWILLTAGIIFL